MLPQPAPLPLNDRDLTEGQGRSHDAGQGPAQGDGENPGHASGQTEKQAASGAVVEKLRTVFEFLAVAVCTVPFLLLTMGACFVLLGPKAAGSRDFIEYWAAGQQLAHGANPYDAAALLQLEQSAGFPAGLPAQIMANPPSALALVMPLGWLGPTAGELLWILLLLASLIASIEMLRSMHGRPRNLLRLLGYAFAPAFSCLLAGQVTLFLLLGLVLFLRLHTTKPFWAGASLWLCLLKPHLFVPFGVVLLAWIISTRAYRILAGCLAALAMTSALATLVDRQVWTQYAAMMNVLRVDKLPLPCLSVLVRQYVPPHAGWLQALPGLAGCLWALFFWRKYRHRWDWLRQGSLLMLVSVLVAPYSWFMDQAVLLAALLHGVFLTRSRLLVTALALISAAIEIGTLSGVKLYSPFYLWTAPAWLLWYLLATRQTSAETDRQSRTQITERARNAAQTAAKTT